MWAIQDQWVQVAKGVPRAPQGNQVKMENQENQETLERWDSLVQWDPEDFQGHQGHQDSKDIEAMGVHWAKRVREVLLDPRARQAPLVRWEGPDPWALLGCPARGDDPDPAAHRECVVSRVMLANPVQWVPWVSVDHPAILEPQE